MLRRRARGAGRRDDQLRLAERRLVPLPARPVPDPGAAAAGRHDLAHLHYFVLAVAAADASAITVKARRAASARAGCSTTSASACGIRARGPAGIFTIPMRGDAKYLFISAGTGITPSLSMTSYLYDRGLGHRRRAHQLRPPPGRDHLPEAAGADGHARPVDQAALHRRAGGPLRGLDRLPRPAEPAHARPDRQRLPGARGLLLRPRAVHAGGARHADRPRLRHGPLSSGELRARRRDPGRRPRPRRLRPRRGQVRPRSSSPRRA